MKYWIIIDRQQAGPFELDSFETIEFGPETPVWHEGLADWTPASEVAELNAILLRRAANVHFGGGGDRPDVVVDAVETETVKIDPASCGRISNIGRHTDKRPSNYLGWAIAATILCCVPLGVVAIIYSASVNSKFDRGDIAGAEKASDTAQWLIILSIVLGLVMMPFQALISLL